MFQENKKKTQKKKVFLVFSFFLFAGILFTFGLGESSSIVHAQATGSSWNPFNWVGNAFATVIEGLLYGIFAVVSWLVSAAVTLFGWAVDPKWISGPNGFLNRQVIYDLWKFVRDFFNLFFILVILFIAFCTVFHIEKYHYKSVLLNLVIMALLVNFSFPIARFLIDATNVPMYFFLNQALTDPSNPGSSLGTALSSSQLQNILIPEKIGEIGIAKLITAIIFVFIFGVTLLVLALMFVVRLIALILLVIFSSVGFACSFIPGMESYSSQWWETFWKYALFGPAAALMLLVSLKFMAMMGDDFTKMKSVAITNTAITDPGFIASMAFFSIPIILLWFTIGLANSFSIAGAGTVTGMAEKVAKWVGRQTTITPLLWAERKYEKAAIKNKFTRFLAPQALYHGFEKWRERSHELDEKAIHQSGAEISDAFSYGYSKTMKGIGKVPVIGWAAGKLGMLGEDYTDNAFQNFSANVAKEQKHIASISTNSDYVLHELITGLQAKDDDKVVGALQILAQQNDLNDMMHAMGRIQKETGLKFGKDGEELPAEMSTEGAKLALVGMMRAAGLSEEMIAKNMLNLSNTAIAAGNVGMAGAARFDESEHKFIVTDEEDTAKIAAVKLQNLETQARQRTLHHNAIFKELPPKEINGKKVRQYGGLNGVVGERVLGTITAADIRESHRSRDDLKREVAVRMQIYEKGEDLEGNKVDEATVETIRNDLNKVFEKNGNVKNYFETIYAQQTGKVIRPGAYGAKGEPDRGSSGSDKSTTKEPDRSPTAFREATGPITLEK